MSYAVKEAYYTLQGEGANTGRAAVFLRFTGCNLWSGRAQDRDKGAGGCARWCDTDFVGTDGPGGGRFATAPELADHVARVWDGGRDAARGSATDGGSGAAGGAAGGGEGRRFVVCTGGEPLLQLDEAAIAALRRRGFDVAVETNGTLPAPPGLAWICVSPKRGGTLVLRAGDELKLVVPQEGLSPDDFAGMAFDHFLLQPLDDGGDGREANTRLAVAYCLAHPRWRLSLQTHKLLGLP